MDLGNYNDWVSTYYHISNEFILRTHAETKRNEVLLNKEDWDNPKQDALVKLPRPVALVP